MYVVSCWLVLINEVDCVDESLKRTNIILKTYGYGLRSMADPCNESRQMSPTIVPRVTVFRSISRDVAA